MKSQPKARNDQMRINGKLKIIKAVIPEMRAQVDITSREINGKSLTKGAR